MPELTTADVQQYTRGRLAEDDAETVRMLDAALAAARNYCGWHVTPIHEDEEVTVDGPNASLLWLPTRNLIELTEVIEDEITLDVTKLRWSARGSVRKKSGAHWSCDYRAITVTMTHGFAVASDFDEAVLSMLDRASRGSGAAREVAGVYQVAYESSGSASALSATEKLKLDFYRIVQPPGS